MPAIKPCSSEQKSQADVIVTFQPYSESDSYQKTYGGQLKGMDLPIRGYVVELSEKNKDQWDFRETLVADSTTDKLFDEFDANKDGGIARNELENFLLHVDKRFFDNMLAASGERCDMAKGEILDELFTELDADGSGIIDKREFIDYLRATNQETSRIIVKNNTLKHLHCTDLVGQRFSQRKIRPTGERACKQSTLR